MDQKNGPLGLSPNFSIVGLATDVLDQTDVATASDLIEALACADDASLALAADTVRMGLKESDTPHAWARNAQAPVAAALGTAIRGFTSQPARSHPRLLSYLYAHFHLSDPPTTSELLWDAIDSGSWDLHEVLGLLIPLGQASNGEDTWTSMGDFSESTIEDMLGVDKVLTRIPEQPELLNRHDPNDYFDRRVDADDLDARIEFALTGLERVRARRQQAAEASEAADDSDPDETSDDEERRPDD
jgi:hypothetical protein